MFTPDEKSIIASSWAHNSYIMKKSIQGGLKAQSLLLKKGIHSLAVSPGGDIAFADGKGVYMIAASDQQWMQPKVYIKFKTLSSSSSGPTVSVVFSGCAGDLALGEGVGGASSGNMLLALDKHGTLESWVPRSVGLWYTELVG